MRAKFAVVCVTVKVASRDWRWELLQSWLRRQLQAEARLKAVGVADGDDYGDGRDRELGWRKINPFQRKTEIVAERVVQGVTRHGPSTKDGGLTTAEEKYSSRLVRAVLDRDETPTIPLS